MSDTQERKAVEQAIRSSHPWASFLGRSIKRTGIPITRFAKLVGIHRSTAYRWLEGRVDELSTAKVETVAAVLYVDLEDALAAAGHAARAPAHQVDSLSAPAAGEHEGRPVPPGFGEWLVNTRFRAGYLTSEDLGKAVGIATKLIEDWEDGKSGPHAVDVFALASALRLPVLTVAAQAGHVNPTAAATQELMDDPAVSDEKKAAIRQVVDWARQQRAAG